MNTEKTNLEAEKPALSKGDVMPRFILDIRCGCAAVRDTEHPRYDKDYPGLHHDTCDVVEYKHGYKNTEKECWEMAGDDIKYLTDYCASLNGV
jgi:hypothetical protein